MRHLLGTFAETPQLFAQLSDAEMALAQEGMDEFFRDLPWPDLPELETSALTSDPEAILADGVDEGELVELDQTFTQPCPPRQQELTPDIRRDEFLTEFTQAQSIQEHVVDREPKSASENDANAIEHQSTENEETSTLAPAAANIAPPLPCRQRELSPAIETREAMRQFLEVLEASVKAKNGEPSRAREKEVGTELSVSTPAAANISTSRRARRRRQPEVTMREYLLTLFNEKRKDKSNKSTSRVK